MRRAETLLNIIRKRGQRGLPVKDAYRLLYQRDLYLRAYGKIYRNAGAMTPGVNAETVDGMSLEKIDAIIEALRYERYRWTPVRRIYIPKKNGKRRPLGYPPGRTNFYKKSSEPFWKHTMSRGLAIHLMDSGQNEDVTRLSEELYIKERPPNGSSRGI